jgi:uncharacterized ferredoxin-like protein
MIFRVASSAGLKELLTDERSAPKTHAAVVIGVGASSCAKAAQAACGFMRLFGIVQSRGEDFNIPNP